MIDVRPDRVIIKNLLFIGAHPDDLEVMAGGTVRRVIEQGGRVHALTMTKGAWKGPDGTTFRDGDIAVKEAKRASELLGYSVEHLNESVLGVQYKDSIVKTILGWVEKIHADTILCPWIEDLQMDHQVTAKMAVAASRKVPRILMAQASWHLGTKIFSPNVFFDITRTFNRKMAALACYDSEMKRVGDQWRNYHDALTRYYGLIAGVERAEGFLSYKFCM